MTAKQRNDLLHSMTDAVADLVLTNNFRQAQALSLAERQARFRASEYQRFIVRLETDARLDRALEGLPSDKELDARSLLGKSLTRPELAVLLCHAKIHLKEHLIAGVVHRDAVVAQTVFEAFPRVIRERFAEAVRGHRLYAELVATMVANDIVHHFGVTSIVHLSEFVGGEVEEIARAYFAAAACFRIRERFREIEALPGVDGETRVEMLLELMQLARRATRWLLRHRRSQLDVAALTAYFQPRIDALLVHATGLMGEAGSRRRQTQLDARVAKGVPLRLAEATGNAGALAVTLPVIDAAERMGCGTGEIAGVFAAMNQTLGFDWLAEQIMALPAQSLWQAMERDALVDELVTQHAALAAVARRSAPADVTAAVAVEGWMTGSASLIGTWRRAIDGAQHAPSQDFSLYSMTLRKLGDLVRALAV